jgi:hypothetical protein
VDITLLLDNTKSLKAISLSMILDKAAAAKI